MVGLGFDLSEVTHLRLTCLNCGKVAELPVHEVNTKLGPRADCPGCGVSFTGCSTAGVAELAHAIIATQGHYEDLRVELVNAEPPLDQI